MRTIVIGDLHGNVEPLKKMLKLVNYKKSDKLILLGDYIDKGLYSCELLDYLKSIKNNNVILIRGNHDEFLIGKNNVFKNLIWLLSGKSNTIKSFERNNKSIDDYKDWLRDNTVTYYEDKEFQCCHASIKRSNIKDNSNYTLTHNRIYSRLNRYKGKFTIIGHLDLREPCYYKGNGKKIKLKYNFEYVIPWKGILCIDTGCYKRRLTAMVIEGSFYELKEVKNDNR